MSDAKSLDRWIKDYKKGQQTVLKASPPPEYTVVEGEVPEGWEVITPNCRTAPMPLAAARVARQRMEAEGTKAIVVACRGSYAAWALRRRER